MNKFSCIIALFLYLRIAQGLRTIAGNVEWNSTGKALSKDKIEFKYIVENIGGVGGVGENSSSLHKASLRFTGEKVTMKIENPKNRVCYLPREVHVYEDLQKGTPNLLVKGFANIFDYGVYFDNNYRVLILSRLGLDLLGDLKKNKMLFYKWSQLRFIATSAIDRLQFLHDAGYIHQDIRPTVFVYGFKSPKIATKMTSPRVSLTNRIYLTDLGQAIKYKNENGTCLEQSAAAPYTTATAPFYSRTFRENLSQGRRDDMEMLGYVLLVLAGVKLPWEGLKNETEITKQQSRLCDDLDVGSICRESEVTDNETQAAFSTYFFLLKTLFTTEDGFCQKPDYAAFRKCFDEDPKARYFNVSGKRFTSSILGKVVGKIAKKNI